MAGASQIPAGEPEMATPPRPAAKTNENITDAPAQNRAASNNSSQADEEHVAKAGAAPAGEEGKPSKSRPALPRPEGTVNCPRCTSAETKFCYYNNYNVKQPRYFCKACQRYWTEGGMLRNVPVGAGRRKNKPALGRTQDGVEAGAKAGDASHMVAAGHAASYPPSGSVHTDYPSAALCNLHQHDHSHVHGPASHDMHGGVPAGTLSAMAGTASQHGPHGFRYQAHEHCPPFHRCPHSHDPHAPGHGLPGGHSTRCPSCSQYLHATSGGEDSSRRVRPRLDEHQHDQLPGHAEPSVGESLLPSSLHPMQGLSGRTLLPQGKLPASPPGSFPPHHSRQTPGAPATHLPGPLGTQPPLPPQLTSTGLPAHPGATPPQASLYPSMPLTGGPYPHEPSPSQSQQSSLAATLAAYPSYRPQGPAAGLGMGMGVGGLAAQMPGSRMGYLGMGSAGLPGGAGMQQAAGMAQGGWMSLAAVAGQHQEAVQRAAQAQQQLAAAQQQLQQVASYQAQQQLMQSSHQASAPGWPPSGAQAGTAGSYAALGGMSWPYGPLYGSSLHWPGYSGHTAGWDGARMEEMMAPQARTPGETASMEAAAAATMHTAQSMHSAAMNTAAAAGNSVEGAAGVPMGHGIPGHNHMMAIGPLHAQASGLQQASGAGLLAPTHPHSISTHYPSPAVQPHWPSFNLGAGGLDGSHSLLHVAPSRDTHGDGDQCTC